MSHLQICPGPCEGFVDRRFRIFLWHISELNFPFAGSQQGSGLVGAWDPHLRDVGR